MSAIQGDHPTELLGVCVPLVKACLDAGCPPAAVLDMLYDGHRLLRRCDPLTKRMSIISYRCVKSDDDGWTLDAHAFLSALSAAQAFEIDFLWLDAFAYRRTPYVHSDFCTTLAHVMCTTSHVVWLPRSRRSADGQYQERLWCTFEASMVAMRPDVTVSIGGHPLSAMQRRIMLYGSFLLVPNLTSVRDLATPMARLGLVNILFFIYECLMIFFFVMSAFYDHDVAALYTELPIYMVGTCLIWLFCRHGLGESCSVARNGKGVLRTMLRANRSSALGKERSQLTLQQLLRRMDTLQKELPWLPAYDRRDVITVKTVLKEFAQRVRDAAHAAEGGTRFSTRYDARGPAAVGNADDFAVLDRIDDAQGDVVASAEATSPSPPFEAKASEPCGAAASAVKAGDGADHDVKSMGAVHENVDAVALSLFTASTLDTAPCGDKPDPATSVSEWFAKVGMTINVATASAGAPWFAVALPSRTSRHHASARPPSAPKRNVATISSTRRLSFTRAPIDGSVELTFEKLAGFHWLLVRGVQHIAITPKGAFFAPPPQRVPGSYYTWELRDQSQRTPSTSTARQVFAYLFFGSSVVTLFLRGLSIGCKVTAPHSDVAWRFHVMMVGWVAPGFHLVNFVYLNVFLVLVPGYQSMRRGFFPLPVRLSGKLEYGFIMFGASYVIFKSYTVGIGQAFGLATFVFGISQILLAASAAIASAMRYRNPLFLFEISSAWMERGASIVR